MNWRDADRITRLHGITLEEKYWLVLQHQNGVCPVCRDPLVVEGSTIDHWHGCPNKAVHKTRQKQSYGCRQCIRGALHLRCNSTILHYLEKYSHLQTDEIKEYLKRRPFVKSNVLIAEQGPIQIFEKSS